MRWRCVHRWEEVGRVFNHGKPQSFHVRNVDPEDIERIMHGFTNVTYRCSECGEVRVHDFTGQIA